MEEDARLSIITGIGAKNEVTLSLIIKLCGATGEDTRSITLDLRVVSTTKSLLLGLLESVSWKAKFMSGQIERKKTLPMDRWHLPTESDYYLLIILIR